MGERAAFACDPGRSRGRLIAEPEATNRSAFQRDRDRIIHSTAFRRLKHKTQVFVYHEGDHFRTRLTHSLEVAQIARAIARTLGLDEDLAEALALAHDFGHTPFGHAGEDALDACMKPWGGFDHNAQTLRIVTRLEQKYADFDGLNLTWETLEGLVKHNGPMDRPVPRAIADYVARHDLEIATWPSLEAQVAAIADDIAYDNHDIDDGLRAGLFTVEDLAAVPFFGEMFREVEERYPGIDPSRLIHEAVRRLIGDMVDDVVAETRARVAEARPRSVEDVRGAGRALAGFSAAMAGHDKALKAFLHGHMYRHYKVNRMMSKARRIVTDLFALYMAEPGILPDGWRRSAEEADEAARAALVADFIAGMTDRFAIEEHRRLFDLTSGDL
nr:deoxyguanosinetriphosphate triphosphohydrolase [Futiania mangrovii]